MNPKNLLGSVVLIIIQLYGIMRFTFLRWYTAFIGLFLDIETLNNELNYLSRTVAYRHDIAGWLIYYPTYLMLHIIFIMILFRKNRKIRNTLCLSLISVVLVLITIIIISKYTGFNSGYRFAYETFQRLFGLPFILLFIEGGRILYNDIVKLSHKK